MFIYLEFLISACYVVEEIFLALSMLHGLQAAAMHRHTCALLPCPPLSYLSSARACGPTGHCSVADVPHTQTLLLELEEF